VEHVSALFGGRKGGIRSGGNRDEEMSEGEDSAAPLDPLFFDVDLGLSAGGAEASARVEGGSGDAKQVEEWA
jgi:hypothetical protein